MAEDARLVVGMPAYNEEKNIGCAVENFLEQEPVDEIIVVDNNSTDNTVRCAKEAGATVVTEPKQGYGYACQRALEEANQRGELLCLVEPDGTFVAEDIDKFLAYSRDFNFVVGTRTAKELIWEGANMGPFLRWGNWSVGKMMELTYNTCNLTDVGCTFRLIKSEAYEGVREEFTVGGSHFSPEMMVRIAKSDYSMIEIPVNYRAREGDSKITGDFWAAFKLGIVMILFILKERFGK